MANSSFEPVLRRSLPEQVFDRIVARIVGGEFEPGAYLPSERRLAEILGVNRGAIREAIRKLEQAGLVDTRHGGGSQVLDYRASAGPELLPRLLFRDGRVDTHVARSVLEMRNALAPEIAARCAERADADMREEIARLAESMTADTPLSELQDRSLELWSAIVRGSGNVAFELSFNALRAAYEPIQRTLLAAMAAELTDERGHRALGRAIAGGRPDAARRAARAILSRSTDAFDTILSNIERKEPRGSARKTP
ncbi:MAG: FadR family transcriptional regulator [Deltaproteobacteria bacterium]|nr:MAG: FadR family transcriptional regulator [Deltaproteobacteria bacterium]